MRSHSVSRTAFGLLACLLTAGASLAQDDASGASPAPTKSPAEAGPCITAFQGNTTIAGGWTAFETVSGTVMEVLHSGAGNYTVVTDIPSSLADLDLDRGHLEATVGVTWCCWSHGYMGEVLWSTGYTTPTTTMPSGTEACDFYIQPNSFTAHALTRVGYASDGSADVVVVTASGASHAGFYTDGTGTLDRVEVSGTSGWAIGELRVGDGAPACITGVVGDRSLAGGWGLFDSLSGLTMEVLDSGLPDFSLVSSLPTASSGPVGLIPDHEKRTIGSGWASWSHGYTGEVFWTRGSTSSTISMPGGTRGFDLYIEQNPWYAVTFTLDAFGADGSSAQIFVTPNGHSGASHGGFYTSPGCFITHVDISGLADYAVGELRVSANVGTNYCSVNPSSTGFPAILSANGSTSIATNDFNLRAWPVPNQPFLFFYGPNSAPGEPPFGNGFLCILAPITRLLPPQMAIGNLAMRTVDISAFVPGTLFYQCWFRDPAAGGAFFNTSDGLSVLHTP